MKEASSLVSHIVQAHSLRPQSADEFVALSKTSHKRLRFALCMANPDLDTIRDLVARVALLVA
jgi:hypothetical protein